MDINQLRLPTVAEYVTAFRAVEFEITDNQRTMLHVHHAAPARTMSATRLAEAVGFENLNGVNLQYGLLADKIAHQLAVDLTGHVRLSAPAASMARERPATMARTTPQTMGAPAAARRRLRAQCREDPPGLAA